MKQYLTPTLLLELRWQICNQIRIANLERMLGKQTIKTDYKEDKTTYTLIWGEPPSTGLGEPSPLHHPTPDSRPRCCDSKRSYTKRAKVAIETSNMQTGRS